MLRVDLGVAVLAGPVTTDCVFVVAQHVDNRHPAQHRSEQVRALHHAGGHQQPAVAAALYSQFQCAGVFVFNQPLGRGDKIIEDILLILQHPGPVPLFAILVAASQAGHSQHTTLFHPQTVGD